MNAEPPVTPERSELMRRVKGKNSKPEMMVRRTAHAMGYRYRLHVSGLPGHPDLVFPARRKVIFVHGCFWHRHPGCRRTTTPTTRSEFWQDKFRRNVARDASVERRLADAGWRVLVIWECETFDIAALSDRIGSFLEGDERLSARTTNPSSRSGRSG